MVGIYQDKIKQMKQNDLDNPIYIGSYDYFLTKYGIKKIAEGKLL